jgi:3-oxoacyl-[acyl-carrier protein] reductase
MSERDFEGKTALVTGGSRGIGAGTARALAARGARVVVSGRDEARLAGVVAGIRAAGGQAIAHAADVTDAAALAGLREAAETAFGPVEVLMAFAGGLGEPVPFLELPEARWRASVDANLTATFLTLQAFLPRMVERRRGAVVTMASTAGRQPGRASAAYGAAKAGIIMLTHQVAGDMAPHGVRINCVAPSAIRTERMEAFVTPERLEALAASFPLGRVGEVEDVAEAALFLASDQASWITGVVLDLTGGRVMA